MISTDTVIIPLNRTIIGGITMDRITQGFLDEFALSHNLKMLDTDVQFEHFSNYCALSNEIGLVDIDIQDMHTGNATQGIDGIAIEVNGSIVNCKDDIDLLVKQNKKLDVKFIFVQAKTTDSFDNAEIGNFLTFVETFFSDNAKSIFATEEMAKFLEIKEYIYANSRYMRFQNPIVCLYYIAPGKWNSEDPNLKAVVEAHKSSLESSTLFSSIIFIGCGAQEIQRLYRKSQQQIEATFTFAKNVMMFSDDNGDFGYSGVLPFNEFFKIICEQNGSLKCVFEDNIRDFLGENNDVNSDIGQTITGGRRSAFCMLNNGITIVADSAILVSDKMTISNYQIVNGCQTSHVLYLNRNTSGIDELLIPVKIIVTQNEDLKNSITKATNNQSSITKEQLEALSTFQKTLEEYYKTYTDSDEPLFYERRVGQYRDASVPKARIVSIRAQLKNAAAMFANKPHNAAGYYSSLINDIGVKVFRNDDKPILYYTSSMALYRFESLVKNKQIEATFRKGKYHAIMLLKFAVEKKVPKYNNSKAMVATCQKILTVLNDPERCLCMFNKVIDYIKQQAQIDLNDRKVFERKETTDVLLQNINQLTN